MTCGGQHVSRDEGAIEIGMGLISRKLPKDRHTVVV